MTEEPTDLFYSLNDAYDSGERRHASDVVKELGITYERWEGQPIADQIKLHRCRNVPKELPSFISDRRDYDRRLNAMLAKWLPERSE